MKRKLSIIALLLAFAVLFTACGQKQPAQSAGESNGPAKEQILQYATDGEPAGLDPHKVPAAASIRIYGKIYNSLVDMDENGEFQPELSESWKQPDDVTYIFKLKQGVKFHNGREMTADDVKYSFERILNPDTAAVGRSYFSKVQSVEAVDKYTVKFSLSDPYAPFMAYMTSVYASIVPKEVVEEKGNLMQTACGTGPFMLKEWIPDNHVTLVKNPSYFMDGQPKLDGIVFHIMPDESSRLAALRTGKVHITKLSPQSIPLVKDNKDINIISYQSNEYSYLGFNMTIEPFNNKKVRQAISLAVNRPEIAQTIYGGNAVVSGPVPPSLKKWSIDVESTEMYQYNIEKAKQLLAEAGYPNGFETVITAGLYDDIRDTAQLLQKQLEAIGIKATIQNLESGQYVDAWKNKNHQMMAGRNGSGSDPDRALGFFFSTKGSANVWGYSNPEFDALTEEAKITVDETKRLELYKKAQEILIDDSPNLFIISPMDYYFTRTELKGFNPDTFNTEDFENVVIALLSK